MSRLIDADALIEDLEYDVELDARQLDDMDFVGKKRELVQFDKDCKQNAIDLLRHAPTIEPEPSQVAQDIATIIENEKDMRVIGERKTGKWIDYTDEGYVECPFCHSATNCEGNKEELHYCFSCGARMETELRNYENKGDDD